MPSSQTEEIKARLDVAEVVRQYVRIEKAGINMRGLCPFHKEKTPSFFVSPARQTWKCFGCGKGGDIFTFIEEIEGVEFPEALRTLAQQAGVELVYEDPAKRSARARLFEINEKATAFFEANLIRPEAEFIRAYIEKRGISGESVANFRIGYAPAQGNLAAHLKEIGFKEDEIITAGLALRSERKPNEIYDRFRGRIMFPIANIQGQVVAFGGRITDEESARMKARGATPAKYINSPETPLYNKSSILYGLEKAKSPMREKDACIIVEGYTDVIMAHQAGSNNIVASSGTALTARQLELIQRYTNNLYTSFDMDVAGDTATKRGIDLAQEKGFNIKVITISGGKDPAEVIKDNKEEWERGVKEALSIYEFYFQTTLARFNAGLPEDKVKIGRIILPVLERIPNRIEKAHWVQKLAHALKIDEQHVWTELEAVAARRAGTPEDNKPFSGLSGPETKDRTKHLKERALALLVKYPELQENFNESFLPRLTLQDTIDKILDRIAKAKTPQTFTMLIEGAGDEEKKIIDTALFKEEILSQMPSVPAQEFLVLDREWQKEFIHARLKNIHFEIRAAEESEEDATTLLTEARELTNKLVLLD